MKYKHKKTGVLAVKAFPSARYYGVTWVDSTEEVESGVVVKLDFNLDAIFIEWSNDRTPIKERDSSILEACNELYYNWEHLTDTTVSFEDYFDFLLEDKQ